MMGFGDRHEPIDPSQAPLRKFGRAVPPEFSVDRRRTGYPLLRRALSAHLRDIAEFVNMDQPDAARSALQMALAIRSETEIAPAEGR